MRLNAPTPPATMVSSVRMSAIRSRRGHSAPCVLLSTIRLVARGVVRRVSHVPPSRSRTMIGPRARPSGTVHSSSEGASANSGRST